MSSFVAVSCDQGFVVSADSIAFKQPVGEKKYGRVRAFTRKRPVRKPWPTLYAGGESEDAKRMISRYCDGYLMHGDPPENVRPKVEEMERRRSELGFVCVCHGITRGRCGPSRPDLRSASP